MKKEKKRVGIDGQSNRRKSGKKSENVNTHLDKVKRKSEES